MIWNHILVSEFHLFLNPLSKRYFIFIYVYFISLVFRSILFVSKSWSENIFFSSNSTYSPNNRLKELYSIFIYHSIIIYLPKFYLFLKPSKRILFPFSFIITPLLFFALPTSKSWSENTFHPNSIYFFIPSKGTSYVLSKCISKSIVFFQRKDTRIFRTLSMDTKRTRVQLPSLRDNEITRKKIKHSKSSVSKVHVK